MAERIDYKKHFPEGVKALFHLGNTIKSSGLEAALMELVKIRASQINGCAFCIDMHTQDARAGGETEQRIYALSAWRETPFFAPRERAALAWTEAITEIAQGHAPDAVYNEARSQFNEEELVKLTLAVTQINSWNRIAIGFRIEPGSYRAQSQTASAT